MISNSFFKTPRIKRSDTPCPFGGSRKSTKNAFANNHLSPKQSRPALLPGVDWN